ncbi:unnamed protein product [Phaedon cochleariae]|nr:unnamed protein product [Phaedon cochleariae]
MDYRIFHLISLCLIFVESRGPHHPRGDKIVKRHVHYKPIKDASEKLTEDVQLLHDQEHLQEHLDEIIPEPDFSKMSDEELEFYYFQVHDSDKNSKLDGLEILQAISHTDEHGDSYEEDGENDMSSTTEKSDLEYYVELIDQVLREDDIDDDGYLSYAEYVARRRNKPKNKEDLRSPAVMMVP